MKKMIDGIEIECSQKEENEILSQWKINEIEEEAKKKFMQDTKNLMIKYPCILRELNALHAKIDAIKT